MTGDQPASLLAHLRAAHPTWVIRRDAGQDWTCWTAQRVQVAAAPTLDELGARLGRIDGTAVGDPRVIRTRQLAAEHHQPLTMTPGDLRHLLARWQRAAAELLDAIDETSGGPPCTA
jgi:hypothetical protein